MSLSGPGNKLVSVCSDTLLIFLLYDRRSETGYKHCPRHLPQSFYCRWRDSHVESLTLASEGRGLSTALVINAIAMSENDGLT
ncbi:hypothetical protein EVAR_7495_1 [Eumeta japonica]|uniref:Uncharacterized protein n=1 Tax=Eumeta variegata TaxID=151549 RepID=A0A4C1Y2V9_EUMVA|nr:hypothetical protein EVAR_7495_1 [Eumeta japonica]